MNHSDSLSDEEPAPGSKFNASSQSNMKESASWFSATQVADCSSEFCLTYLHQVSKCSLPANAAKSRLLNVIMRRFQGNDQVVRTREARVFTRAGLLWNTKEMVFPTMWRVDNLKRWLRVRSSLLSESQTISQPIIEISLSPNSSVVFPAEPIVFQS